MPLPIDIDALLHGTSVEWERLEFKTGWNPLAILHTLCAFANDFHNLGGGYLVLGVSELNGQAELPPRGLATGELDMIQKEILNLGYSALQPPYNPVVVPYEIDGRHILVLWAPGGQTRPYKARVSLSKDNQTYAYFIRKGSSTVRARGTDEAELLSMAATVPFDDRLNRQARVEDLSPSLIQDFLNEVDSQLAHDAPALELTALGRQMNIVNEKAVLHDRTGSLGSTDVMGENGIGCFERERNMDTDETTIIGELVEKLRAYREVRKIVLFGSRARDEGRPDSDYDLCVIVDGVSDPRAFYVTLMRGIASADRSVDLLVLTESDFGRRLAEGWSAIKAVAKEGRVLYAA